MAENTDFLKLYRWDKKDNKIDTINGMTANMEKIDKKFKDIEPIVESAVNATQSATEAATLANGAAALASEKAELAETNATEALTQAQFAKEKADYIAANLDLINAVLNDFVLDVDAGMFGDENSTWEFDGGVF